jgi:hypothetical protein
VGQSVVDGVALGGRHNLCDAAEPSQRRGVEDTVAITACRGSMIPTASSNCMEAIVAISHRRERSSRLVAGVGRCVLSGACD